MNEFTVQYSPLSGNIYAGRVNKAGTAFTSKNDVTIHALLSVAEKVYEEDGGVAELKPNTGVGPSYRITVERF